MDIKKIERFSKEFIKRIYDIVQSQGLILTELSFVKGDESIIHVQIGARQKETDNGKILWWTCALPLNVSPKIMAGRDERKADR